MFVVCGGAPRVEKYHRCTNIPVSGIFRWEEKSYHRSSSVAYNVECKTLISTERILRTLSPLPLFLLFLLLLLLFPAPPLPPFMREVYHSPGPFGSIAALPWYLAKNHRVSCALRYSRLISNDENRLPVSLRSSRSVLRRCLRAHFTDAEAVWDIMEIRFPFFTLPSRATETPSAFTVPRLLAFLCRSNDDDDVALANRPLPRNYKRVRIEITGMNDKRRCCVSRGVYKVKSRH